MVVALFILQDPPSHDQFHDKVRGDTLSLKEMEVLSKSVNDAIDQSVSPCDDFYQFSCGQWKEDNKDFPEDRSSWSRSFTLMAIRNEAILEAILDAKWPLLGTLYDNCMDMETRDERGTEPLQEWITAVDELSDGDSEGLATLLARLHSSEIGGFFDLGVGRDFMNPLINILEIDQGGYGMPNRDYYFGNSTNDLELQNEYQKHIGRLFALLDSEKYGADEIQTQIALSVYYIEKTLAANAMEPADRRDPYKLYHIKTMAELSEIAPNFPWATYFEETGLDLEEVSSLNVVTIEFLVGFSQWLGTEQSYTRIKYYLMMRIMAGSSLFLSSAFLEERYLWAAALQGSSQPPNDRICLGVVTSILGELLGRYYVKDEFADNSKDIALDMIRRIESSFVENLPTVEWMDAKTAELATEKMVKITNKIGYPDKWRSYDELEVQKGRLFETWRSYSLMMTNEAIDEVQKPVDKAKWYMTPQTVNAYYSPLGNEIVFPAAILQPSFFEARYPPAFNFGGIGMVMGHELSHGFDDQGRQFNGDGLLVQWWEKEAVEKFDGAAQCVVDLYDNFTIVANGETLNVNGRLTEGENIADMGGVKLSYHAFNALRDSMEKKKREARDEEPPEFDWPYYQEELVQEVFGFSSSQLFFLSMAQNWCQNVRDSHAAQSIHTDPHSPSQFRVNGPLSQFPEFGKAFDCPVGSPMAPKEYCSVW